MIKITDGEAAEEDEAWETVVAQGAGLGAVPSTRSSVLAAL